MVKFFLFFSSFSFSLSKSFALECDHLIESTSEVNRQLIKFLGELRLKNFKRSVEDILSFRRARCVMDKRH